MVAFQRVVGDHLEVTFLPAPHQRSLAGALHQEGEEPKVRTRADLEEAVRDAIAELSDRGEDRDG